MAFKFIKDQMDYNTEKYQEISERRSEAGRKGGAPNGNSNAMKVNELQNSKTSKTSKTSYIDIDIDTDIEKKKNTENKFSASSTKGAAEAEAVKKGVGRICDLKQDTVWMKTVARKFKRSEEEIAESIDECDAWMTCRGTEVKNLKSFFTSWLKEHHSSQENSRPKIDPDKQPSHITESRREREKAVIEHVATRERYTSRVPVNGNAEPTVTFLQYQRLGMDSMPDSQLSMLMERIGSGVLRLPTDIVELTALRDEWKSSGVITPLSQQ